MRLLFREHKIPIILLSIMLLIMILLTLHAKTPIFNNIGISDDEHYVIVTRQPSGYQAPQIWVIGEQFLYIDSQGLLKPTEVEHAYIYVREDIDPLNPFRRVVNRSTTLYQKEGESFYYIRVKDIMYNINYEGTRYIT